MIKEMPLRYVHCDFLQLGVMILGNNEVSRGVRKVKIGISCVWVEIMMQRESQNLALELQKS